MSSKLEQAKLKLARAQEEYRTLCEKEKKRFGDFADGLKLLEMSDGDVIVALAYYAKAPVEEKQKMHSVVLPELPSRFQNKVKANLKAFSEATQTPSSSVNSSGKDETEANHGQ